MGGARLSFPVGLAFLLGSRLGSRCEPGIKTARAGERCRGMVDEIPVRRLRRADIHLLDPPARRRFPGNDPEHLVQRGIAVLGLVPVHDLALLRQDRADDQSPVARVIQPVDAESDRLARLSGGLRANGVQQFTPLSAGQRRSCGTANKEPQDKQSFSHRCSDSAAGQGLNLPAVAQTCAAGL